MTDTTSNKNVNLQNVGRFDPLKIKELQEQIADLRRQNELLREAVRLAREFENWILTSAERDHLQNMHDAIEAAIDGGAAAPD